MYNLLNKNNNNLLLVKFSKVFVVVVFDICMRIWQRFLK